MKKLLTLTCLLILSSCAKEIPSEQLVKRQGVFYEINTTTPFTGSTVGYHKNGQLKSRTNYKNGKYDDLRETYFENGQLQSKSIYKDDELTLSQTFTSKGIPLKDFTYNNGLKTGVEEVYHENGQLKSRENYKDGKGVGFWESYYEDGELEFKGNYKDGEKDGLWEEYYKNGQLKSKENYKDGILINE